MRWEVMTRTLTALALVMGLGGLPGCGPADQAGGEDQSAENGFAPGDASDDTAGTADEEAEIPAETAVSAETLPGTGDDGASQDPTSAMTHNAEDAGEDLFQRGFYPEAMEQWRQEAEEGNDYAAYRLGVEYFDGQRVPRDLNEAARYQQLASELGNPAAMFELASYYEDGIGVEPNVVEAASWYLESARRGYPPAQHNVATMFEDGTGMPQDLVQAYVYYALAIRQGFRVNFAQNVDTGEAEFVDPREHLRDIMTPQQIAEAEAALANWTPVD